MLNQKIENLELQRILVVDDNAFMRAAITKVLSNLGFEHLEQAENGQEALVKLQGSEIDLVLTDIQMPEVNGLEFTKRVRCGLAGAARNLPIIVITSFSGDDTLSSALALDINGFISKPFKPITVIKKVVLALAEVTAPDGKSALSERYFGVETDLDVLLRPKEAEAAEPEEAEEEGGLSLKVYELRPNMRLLHEVRHKNGTLLLAAGFELKQATINRLLELRESLAAKSFRVELPEEECDKA
ncbi:response regulator [Marinobacterium jannaschii]|uniref:response regulator n=1 Tax=Marinobacterium jannaschii TaxID=64970 RepID=UPI000481A1AB|nr:response regulator [Marinobacterium jannaschii]